MTAPHHDFIEKALVLSTSHVPEDETTDDLGFTQEMPRVSTRRLEWHLRRPELKVINWSSWQRLRSSR